MLNWYYSGNGIFFVRIPDGRVRIVKTDGPRPDQPGVRLILDITIDDGIWASAVLSMSVFGERSGDWHKFMDHHHGRKDMLAQPESPRTMSIEETLAECRKWRMSDEECDKLLE